MSANLALKGLDGSPSLEGDLFLLGEINRHAGPIRSSKCLVGPRTESVSDLGGFSAVPKTGMGGYMEEKA